MICPRRTQVQIEVEIEIEQAILLDRNESYQEMEIRVEEIFDEVLAVYVDDQDVGENGRFVTAWPRYHSRFGINADAFDFPLCLAVLNERVFKFIRRAGLQDCLLLKQVVGQALIGVRRKTEGHRRSLGQKILRVIYVAAIGQQIGTCEVRFAERG